MSDLNKKTMDIMQLTTLSFTPFAIILIITGLISTNQSFESSKIILFLLFITTTFNIVTFLYAKAHNDKIAIIQKSRVAFNYAFNISFVFLIVNYWSSIWLLFLLTVIVVSLLDDINTIMSTTISLSLMLTFIYYHHDLLSGENLGFMLINIIVIFIIGFFINQMMKITHT